MIESPVSAAVGSEFSLGEGRLTLGRDAGCGVVINDPAVSLLHAEIRADDGHVFLLDLGSANGVWVGESRVDRHELRPGDRFKIGSSELELVTLSPASDPFPLTPPDSGSLEQTLTVPSGIDWSQTVVAAAFGSLQSREPEETEEDVEESGNRSFLLNRAGLCWQVESGRVEVFGVEIADGRPVGALRHYLSVMPGEGLFGMDVNRYGEGSGFLAVPRAGTRLRQIRIPELRQLAASTEGAGDVPQLVDGWIRGMSKSLVQELAPTPRPDHSVPEDAEVELAANAKLSSDKSVLWLEGEGMRLLFLGLEEVDGARGGLFPVTPDSWVEAVTAPGSLLRVHARTTADRITSPELWRGLEHFQEALCRCEILIKRLALVDKFNQLRTKAEYAETAAKLGRESLVGVLEQKKTEQEQLPPEPGDLLTSLRVIGSVLGIDVPGYPDLQAGASFSDRLTRLTKTSGLRTRRVALRDEWWKADQGPILALWAGTEKTVALLPRGPRAYECFDPVENKRRRVDAKLAERLDPFAYAVYRPLPARTLAARDLLRFGLRGFRYDLWTLVGMGFALGALGALTPLFTGRIFDSAIPEAERGLLAQYGLVLVVAAFSSAAFKITQSVAVLRIEGRLDHGLQAALWSRLLNLPSTFFRRYTAGDLGERAAGISAIRHAFTGVGVSSILGSLSSVFFVVLMLWYDLKLGALAVALCLLFIAATTAINVVQLRSQREELDLRGRISGLVLQIVAGLGKIRVAGAEHHAFRMWAEQFAEQRRKSFRVGRLGRLLAMINSGFPLIASMAVFAALVSAQEKSRETGGGLTTGQFIGFFAAFAQFLTAMQALSEASLNLLRSIPLYERLQPILTTLPESDETKSHPGRLKGAIEISHLHFRYDDDGPWVLRDVTLTIKPGEFVAFVGSSGSGKSTLMRLLLGFETPQRGSIYYDGQDLRNLDLREVRQQLGVVLQESMVLPADIHRNIVGSSSRPVEDAWEAARQAGLDADILAMPMGMNTYISEGGGGLSGGQRQRLLIARAVVGKPRILLMDEATSALDNRAQATVTESLRGLQATRIIIAHRLSTIVDADRIIVFDDGVIVETGTYEELMKRMGLFAQLASRQMA